MWKKVRSEIKYWSQVFLLPIYGLSFLMPRDKNIWALGSTFGRRFADNPKYFYLYLNQYQKKQIRAIWISKNRDVIELLEKHSLEAYYLYSLKGFWYALRAGVYLYDNYSKDICFTLSGGAVKINLWHGTPLKKIQKDNKFDYVRNPRNRKEKLRYWLRRVSDEKPSDYVLTTSDYLKPIFTSAFQTKRVITCGYPRNDNLICSKIQNVLTEKEMEILSRVRNEKKNCQIIMYMPTFRDSEMNFFEDNFTEDLETMLQLQHMVLIIKPHPKSKYYHKYKELEGGNVIVSEPEDDPYPILELTDILITDYSSIYFDFLLKDRPIIFWAYDLKEYLRDSREMYFDYTDFTPGIKVNSFYELSKALMCEDLFRDNRRELLNLLTEEPASFFSERLYYKIKSVLRK